MLLNKNTAVTGAFVLGFFIFGLSTGQATVGGPSFITNLSYDSKTQDVYYIEHDFGGRGGLPEVKSHNINSGLEKPVFPWDYSGSDWKEELSRRRDFVSKLPVLIRIDLEKNKISFKVAVVGEDKIYDYSRLNVKVDVSQEGKAIKTFNMNVCKVGQNINFTGFVVPGTNNLVILVNAITDCFEGGYPMDKVFWVKEVKILDSSALVIRSEGQNRPKDANIIPSDIGSYIGSAGSVDIIVDGKSGSALKGDEKVVSDSSEPKNTTPPKTSKGFLSRFFNWVINLFK